MTYNQFEWIHDFAPKTQEDLTKIRIAGGVACLLSAFNNQATFVFAALQTQYVLTCITNFVNHEYLFALLATLNAFYCNFPSVKGWLHALRGQVVIVYFFASLWKLHPDWLSGRICRGIFLSFEEQGVARGVPWSKLYAAFPDIFVFVAGSGIFLDTLLFSALMFLPPGKQMLCVDMCFTCRVALMPHPFLCIL